MLNDRMPNSNDFNSRSLLLDSLILVPKDESTGETAVWRCSSVSTHFEYSRHGRFGVWDIYLGHIFDIWDIYMIFGTCVWYLGHIFDDVLLYTHGALGDWFSSWFSSIRYQTLFQKRRKCLGRRFRRRKTVSEETLDLVNSFYYYSIVSYYRMSLYRLLLGWAHLPASFLPRSILLFPLRSLILIPFSHPISGCGSRSSDLIDTGIDSPSLEPCDTSDRLRFHSSHVPS